MKLDLNFMDRRALNIAVDFWLKHNSRYNGNYEDMIFVRKKLEIDENMHGSGDSDCRSGGSILPVGETDHPHNRHMNEKLED